MPHVVGKGGHTARLIEDITGVIVGVGDRGDGEAYVTLFGLEQRADAAMAIVRAVAGGGLVPSLTFERMQVSHGLGLGVGSRMKRWIEIVVLGWFPNGGMLG